MSRAAAPASFRYRVEFRKDGAARFVSHLDLQATFERALRRARLPLAFSQGFHPRPRLQFEEPLALGWTSERECLWVDLTTVFPPRELLSRLRAQLPDGLEPLRAFLDPGRPAPQRTRVFRVSGVELPEDAAERLARSFPTDAQTGDAPVLLQEAASGWQFTLRPAGRQPTPSLKKVLLALLDDDLPAALQVRRLAWEEHGGERP